MVQGMKRILSEEHKVQIYSGHILDGESYRITDDGLVSVALDLKASADALVIGAWAAVRFADDAYPTLPTILRERDIAKRRAFSGSKTESSPLV